MFKLVLDELLLKLEAICWLFSCWMSMGVLERAFSLHNSSKLVTILILSLSVVFKIDFGLLVSAFGSSIVELDA